MRELKNIDRLFQENLKDFEVFPPNRSWDTIEGHLENRSIKRRIPIWVKISSIAALFILFFTVGTIYLIPENDFTSTFFPIMVEDNSEGDLITEVPQQTLPVTNQGEQLTTDELVEDQRVGSAIASNSNLDVALQESENDQESFSNEIPNRFLLPDAPKKPLENRVTSDLANNDVRESKFTVATIFAPIYFSSLGGGSGLDAQFKDNPTSGNSSYSYGVKFAYRLNNKFSLQSGVNLISMGYKTSNVYVTPGVALVEFSNLSASPIAGRPENGAKGSESLVGNTDLANINQVFGYIEIPVEVKYSVAEGKFGVNLVGGFSTLLLNKDEVFVEMNNLSQSLGASNNLRSVNFSGNIGLDVDYSIRKNLFINVSPMFKIQTNTFSKNSGSLQPYYLGVYTGLNYKF